MFLLYYRKGIEDYFRESIVVFFFQDRRLTDGRSLRSQNRLRLLRVFLNSFLD